MTIFLAVLAGALTFVLGQFLLRLFVDPIHEMKRTISDIAVALIKHANIFCNPGVAGEERENEVSQDLRNLASRLNAQMYLVPKYDSIHRVFGLPSRKAVSTAMKNLIGISNAVHKTSEDMAAINGDKSDRICDLLRIHVPDEDRADD